MNSKECLENIKHAPGFMGGHSRYKSVLESRIPFLEDIEIIKQDLDRLEKLEKENKVLREKVNHFKNVKNRYRRNEKFVEKENTKLKKVCHILLYKKINIDFLRESKDVDEYNKWISNLMDYRELSPEQYELLKEVFENE